MDANIIIIGGGCAGMQLINKLLQLPHELTGDIILLEKESSQPKKSWCFWAKEHTEYDTLISKSWPKIHFSSDGVKRTEYIAPYRYNYIKSEDFFDYHKKLITDSSRVKVVDAEVLAVISEKDELHVITTSGQLTSSRVYDSRIDFEAITDDANVLWQHFKGYFIETKQDVFDVETVTMMDFDIDQGDAAHFMYVLPFAKNLALVEFTAFSLISTYQDSIYDTYLSDYISKNYGADYQIKSIESGKIPMTDFDFNTNHIHNITLIGSAAGAIKPTTGYAFNRIRKDTKDIIDEFKSSAQNGRGVLQKKRFRFYDNLLLKIIRDEPHSVKQVMEQLFKKNSFTRILDFLDEETSLKQEITIFSRLPIRLFLKQVFKYVFAR